MASASDKIAVVKMNGVPLDLSNDVDFGMLLEDLLKNNLQEHPETLKFALCRAKASVRAYALVNEMERLGLLRGPNDVS
jgi:hypothetical protein